MNDFLTTLSRNQREGRYVGRFGGRAVRSHHTRRVSGSAAWIEVHQRVNGRWGGVTLDRDSP